MVIRVSDKKKNYSKVTKLLVKPKVIFKVKSGSLSQVDLGIGKYFFELGAGKENFEWS